MCLDITKAYSESKKDITCYKIVQEVFTEQTHVFPQGAEYPFSFEGYKATYTPFQHVVIPKPVLLGKKPFEAKYSWENSCNFIVDKGKLFLCSLVNNARSYLDAVDEGFIHVYSTKTALKDNLGWFMHNFNSLVYYTKNTQLGRMAIYKCVIPTGTMYCKGLFTCNDSMCAQKIRFVEKLDIFKF